MRLAELVPLMRDSVGDPRGVFARLRSLDLDLDTLWIALLALTASSVILADLSLRALSWQGALPVETRDTPLLTAVIQLAVLVAMVFAVHWGGRILGGTGDFAGAMLAVIWVQFVLTALQVVQLATILLVPFVAGLIGLAGLILFFWLLTGVVAELHGFGSRPRVFAGLLIGLLGLAMVMVGVMSALGLPFPDLRHV